MDQAMEFERRRRQGRFKLLAILFVFLIPVIAAKLILSNQWYQTGVTNQGRLIEPYLDYQLVFDGQAMPQFFEEQETWHLAYLIPETCQQSCQQQLNLLSSTHQLVAGDKHRVTPIALYNPNSDPVVSQSAPSAEYGDYMRHAVPTFATQQGGSVVIIDKLGQWVMSFEPTDFGSAQEMHQAILGDLKKLLKLSRVG